ncbi:TOBE domain-containing protein [Belnapia sp. T18]|uniref:TOBE domain-containing protein n=1 Tax=Belnapia arida TaxID=2804533 RepID=A0ABS1U698_9PROT|nr:TOBE domain-containing protein [Belnapia arida]MBL6079675.1 TOBE domain-containing protein [Belnapia arida]
MRLSARNQIKGKVVGIEKGQTSGHVRIDGDGGIVISASMTHAAIDEFGGDAVAVIEASDVMVGTN